MRKLLFLFLSVIGLFFFVSCSDRDGDGENGENNFHGAPDKGPVPPKMTLNLADTFGLAVVEKDGAAALALIEDHNKKIEEFGLTNAPKISLVNKGDSKNPSFQLAESGEKFHFSFLNEEASLTAAEENRSQLMSIESDGEVEEALTFEKGEEEDGKDFGNHVQYPSIKTIAVSPTGEIYLHFKDPFIFTQASNSDNPWEWDSGYQCQIFSSNQSVEDLKTDEDGARESLKCIDNQHFISSWRAERESVFQFDNAGNAFYRAELPHTSKQLVYKLKRGKTYEDLEKDKTAITEVINANICVENFLVTQSSGIFYTGQTCSGNEGGGGGDGGFFRYISPANVMTEIARGWWNFIFDIQEADEENEVLSDKAVFFGPNPLSSTTASWDSACVFNFDPSGDLPADRISEVITCGNNIWDWVEVRRQVDVDTFGYGYSNWQTAGNAKPSQSWRREAQRRCEDKSEVFAGGGSQIASIKQDSTGDVYIVGNIRKKREGSLTCNVVFRGPHCVIDSAPVLAVDGVDMDSEAACQAEQGTWLVPGNCNWGSSYGFGACIGSENSWDFTENQCTDTATGQIYSDLRTSTDCLQDLAWVDESCKHSTSLEDAPEDENGNPITYADQDACESEASKRNWSGETVHYQNVTGDLCTSEETGNIDVMWDWNDPTNQFSRMGSDTTSTADSFTDRFIIQHFNCSPVEAASSGDQWTDELKAFGRVDKETKNLIPLSTQNEQAINVWLVKDRVYYSSYDTTQGKYLLKGMRDEARCINPDITAESACTDLELSWSEDQCVDSDLESQEACELGSHRAWVDQYSFEILADFEAYTVSESTNPKKIMVSGLDFSDNSFKTGTLNPDDEDAKIVLNTQLTGVIKSVLVLD